MNDYYYKYQTPITSTFNNSSRFVTMGLFDPLTFVVRLSPKVLEKISSSGNKNKLFWKEEDFVSTAVVIHEMIHWWQFSGSTFGFFESLSKNIQASTARKYLEHWSTNYGPRKPVINAFKQIHVAKNSPDELRLVYNIFKNWLDVDLSSYIMKRPTLYKLLLNEAFFRSVGDCISHQYIQTYASIETCLEFDFSNIIDFRRLDNVFQNAILTKINDFENEKISSNITSLQFGCFEILEGQARFCELQYLNSTSLGKYDMEFFEKRGYFEEPYGDAFKYFIRETGFSWPNKFSDVSVSLFLFACDLSLNSTDLFFSNDYNLENFLPRIHPAIRFSRIAQIIKKHKTVFLEKFETNDENYFRLDKLISQELNEKSQFHKMKNFIETFDSIPLWKEKLSVDHKSIVELPDVPLKFYLLKHYLYLKDKLNSPSFFCWPGANWMQTLVFDFNKFSRNSPPFISHGLNDKIYGTDSFFSTDKGIAETGLFNFWMSQMYSDIIRQWISKNGPFNYEYSWIDPTMSKEFWKTVSNDYFKENLGFDLSKIKIIQ